MSNPVVITAVTDDEYGVKLPYAPGRRGWYVAGKALWAIFALAVFVVMVREWVLHRPHAELAWVSMPLALCLLASQVVGWAARDALRFRPLHKDYPAIALDSAGWSLPLDRSLRGGWGGARVLIDVGVPREDLLPASWLVLSWGKSSVQLPLRALGYDADDLRELLWQVSEGRCDAEVRGVGQLDRLRELT